MKSSIPITRRTFLKSAALAVPALSRPLFGADFSPSNPLFEPGSYQRIDSTERRYHISACCEAIDADTDLPLLWKESGVTDVWIAVWFYGYFPFPWEKMDRYIERIRNAGLIPHFISVPFCHGGGALSPRDPNAFPNLPPEHWKTAKRFDGSENWGFSWHSPADNELLAATQFLYDKYGPCDHFLDDDFRFANSPGEIGGCVCEECRLDFLKTAGFSETRWEELEGDWRENRDTPLLRRWVDYTCDKLTACFRKTSCGVSEVDLGIMVMFMGSERAGIRLDDYRTNLFRVGEMMFDDRWFNDTRNKARELFSSLFHRRFCEPGRAFSETTGYQIVNLSPENMASKLTVSTLSDVRNTMFMSGLPMIPAPYWPVMAPRIKKEAGIHKRIAGRKPVGPFKHFWGLADRYMRGDEAFCLFLTAGVPFEVCDTLPADGWTFLGDASAAEIDRGTLTSPGTVCLARVKSESGRFQTLEESFEQIFQFRRSLLTRFRDEKIPYVEEEVPFVLGRYTKGDGSPDAILLWNVNREDKTVHIRIGEETQTVFVKALDSALLPYFG